MKINNKGLSYIELILVISIASILTGLLAISLGTVNRNNVQKAADSLQSGFKTAQTSSMAKGKEKGALYVYSKKGKCYYSIGQMGAEEQKISSTAIKVIFNIDGTDRVVKDGFVAKFKFDPATGGSLGADYSTNNGVNWTTASAYNLGQLTVTNKSGKMVKLMIRKVTGKIGEIY